MWQGNTGRQLAVKEWLLSKTEGFPGGSAGKEKQPLRCWASKSAPSALRVFPLTLVITYF